MHSSLKKHINRLSTLSNYVISACMNILIIPFSRRVTFFDQSVGTLLLTGLTCILIISQWVVGATASDSQEEHPVTYMSLGESLQIGRENSTTLRMEKNRLLAAKLNSKNVELDWIPDLLAGVSYKYTENNEDEQFGEIFPYLTLSEVTFNDRASYSKKLDAMNKLTSAKINQDVNLRQLYTEIINKYYALLLAQSRLQLDEHFLKQSQRLFQKARIQSQDGLISRMELLKAESGLEHAKMDYETSLNKVELMEFKFKSLIHLKTNKTVRVTGKIEPVFYPVSFEQCKRFAEKNHPVLKLNQRVLTKLPEYRELIDLTSWPTVSLSAYIGSGATAWDSENRYEFHVSVSKPLYDFGKTKRKKRIMALELDDIEEAVQQSNEDFFLGLEFLYKEFVNYGKALAKSHKLNELSEKLARAVEKSYELGAISYEELQKSRTRDKKRKKNYAVATGRYLVAEMVLKLRSGVSDIDTLLEKNSQWLGSGLFQAADQEKMVMKEKR